MKNLEYNSVFTGKLSYNPKDKSLTVSNDKVNKTFSKDEMQNAVNLYKGANRIHKPIPVLFWTDCKNGEFSNWVK